MMPVPGPCPKIINKQTSFDPERRYLSTCQGILVLHLIKLYENTQKIMAGLARVETIIIRRNGGQ
jgi:hypothetical protein